MANRRILVPVAIILIFLSFIAAAAFMEDPDKSFVIIHTNDTHCFYDGDGGVGFPTVTALAEQFRRDHGVHGRCGRFPPR